jgi:HD-GYP domain-containing protein (c-di-GMP phosphodiesterase class II)/DNA-binding CsgD family transcriptional regulator
MPSSLRLADLLAGLSVVADMGYALPVGTSIRSGLIGLALARRLDVGEPEAAAALYTSLLLHVGCVTFSHEMASAFGDDVRANRAGARTNFASPKDVLTTLIPETVRGTPPLATVRAAAFILARGRALGRRYDTTVCEVGRETARRIGLPDTMQRALYEVKEWWNGRGAPRRLKGDEISIGARIARVAGDAALFTQLGGIELALDALADRAGTILDPAVVTTFAADANAILGEVDAGDPRERILASEPQPAIELPTSDLSAIAAAFGDLVDIKTPFTHGHSGAVARLARIAGERLGLERPAVDQLHVAALMHDLGRAGVSNAVWEKPGPLTSTEWEQVRLHAYHSERILASSEVLAPMARIAGMHHERLDGSGYHRGCNARDLSVSARILAAADVYQAMVEPRPHRAALTPARAADEVRVAVRAGQLDGDAAEAVIEAAGQPRGRGGRGSRPGGLTDREVDVLRLLARGRSNREIADRLVISRRTAEHHVQHIYTKLGVSSRAAVALFALEHDLVSVEADGDR